MGILEDSQKDGVLSLPDNKIIYLKLTENQADWVYRQLVYYADLPMSHPENRFIYRIVDKFEKALKIYKHAA